LWVRLFSEETREKYFLSHSTSVMTLFRYDAIKLNTWDAILRLFYSQPRT
jgi:hypothetical protein